MEIQSILKWTFGAIGVTAAVYIGFISLLTIPYFQDHAIYLHAVQMTWGKDLNAPENWGFLPNQVTPFNMKTSDGEVLHAWHILPLDLYHHHESELLKEPQGLVSDVTSRKSLELLREDPEALVVLYLHGAAGTLGSGYRPPSYRALYAAAPKRLHIIAIDYRGFGTSSGNPSEKGLLNDALAVVEWLSTVANIPPSRTMIFAQSLGTAVASSLVRKLSERPDPIYFAGLVFVAPFADVKTLTATYRIGGTIPILSPIARFPSLLNFFNSFIVSKWPSKLSLADYVRHCESVNQRYMITIIHAEDDYDIPWVHSEILFSNLVNASSTNGVSDEDIRIHKRDHATEYGAGGWRVDWRTENGILREEILKHGYHDITMSYPIVTRATKRTFENALKRSIDG